MRWRERFMSDLERISRRLAADPEMRALRERLEERLARARTEIQATRRRDERAAAEWEARREAEWRRLAASEGDSRRQDEHPVADVLPWQRRGSA